VAVRHSPGVGSEPDMPSHDTRPASTWPPWRTWAWFVVASAVVLGPNVAAVVTPFEYFPWTAAPMFAVPPTAHQRAIPIFEIVDAKGESQPLAVAKVTALNDRDFARSFLRTAWGTDIHSPFDHHRDTSPEARRRRVERYFAGVLGRARERKHRPTMRAQRITVGVEVDVEGQKRREPLGHYDVKRGTFFFPGEGAP